jgi:hypothetical protein
MAQQVKGEVYRPPPFVAHREPAEPTFVLFCGIAIYGRRHEANSG